MCEYCEGKKYIAFNEYKFGDAEVVETIEIIDKELFSYSTIECDYKLTSWREKINYCPMCGRGLI